MAKQRKKKPRVAETWEHRQYTTAELQRLNNQIECLQDYIKVLEAERRDLKTLVAKSSGWFPGDLTFRLPAGRFICIDFQARKAGVFSVPEDCKDLLLGAGMNGHWYFRLGPPTNDPPQICSNNEPLPG